MIGLDVRFYSKEFGWYTYVLHGPQWWTEWELIQFIDIPTHRTITEISHGQVEDRFTRLEEKIDQLIALLETR